MRHPVPDCRTPAGSSVVRAGKLKIDIEVDGDRYHRDASGLRKVDDLWRDHQLRGLGWKIVRFWVYELREDMTRCVKRGKRCGGGTLRRAALP